MLPARLKFNAASSHLVQESFPAMLIPLAAFLYALVTTFVAYTLARLAYKALVPKGRLPPGPRGLPFIGNVFDMPTDKPWSVFGRWGETYGMYNALHVSRSHQF